MLCLSGFELYSRWVPLRNSEGTTLTKPRKLRKIIQKSTTFCRAIDEN